MHGNLVFIGTLKKIANCGESMKNRLFIDGFKKIFDKVIVVDVYKPKKRPWCILKMIYVVLFCNYERIVVSCSTNTAYKILKLLIRLNCKNIYYWVVGGCMHETIISRQFDLSVYKQLNMLYVQSPTMVNALMSVGIENVLYVPNSKPVLCKPDIDQRDYSTIKFVFFSRIDPSKGCDMIIKNARLLNKLGYENKYSIDFYGNIDGKYKDAFTQSINGLNNVHYAGFLDVTTSCGYMTLANYNMMLFPTYYVGEGFPGIIIDAYISGVPIIASDWHFNKEIIDEKTGIIIPHHDQEALFEVMKKTIDGTYDLKVMSKNCQDRAVYYDNKYILSEDHLKEIGLISRK